MAIQEAFRTLVNIRLVGGELVRSDFVDLPGAPTSGTVAVRTIELPLNVITLPSVTDPIVARQVDPVTHVHNPLTPDFHIVLTLISTGTPLAGEFLVDTAEAFNFGNLTLSQFDNGKTIELIYTGRGSLVFADEVNELSAGTLIRDEVILPRHISTDVADDYTFPNDVVINGDLNVAGVVNKVASEVLDLTDDVLFMNQEYSGAVGSAPDMGLELNRGNGQGDATNPTLQWDNTNIQWEFTAETTANILTVSTSLVIFGAPDKGFEVADATAENALVSVFAGAATTFRGSKWFRLDTSQFKGWNGDTGTSGQDGIVILG